MDIPQIGVYVGIEPPILTYLYLSILLIRRLKNPDVCGYKQKASLYVDIELQTIKYPDVCGHKQQTSL